MPLSSTETGPEQLHYTLARLQEAMVAVPDVLCPKCKRPGSKKAIEDMGYCFNCWQAMLREQRLSERVREILAASNLPPMWRAATWASSNESDFPLAAKVCRTWEWGPWGLYLYGKMGVGKSHMVACVANEQIRKYRRQVLWINLPEIMKALKTSFDDHDSRPRMLLKVAESAQVLVLDDLGAEYTTEFAKAEILPIINARVTGLLPTIITSNLAVSPSQGRDNLLERMGQRISDRIIERCKLVKVEGDNIRVKMAAGR